MEVRSIHQPTRRMLHCTVPACPCQYSHDSALMCLVEIQSSGYTWGQCNAEAQFSDRRWQMTVMDRRGFLYVAGGEEVESGRSSKQSDVYKSTVSMTAAKSVLSTACPGVQFPDCTSGLSCWPGSGVKMTPLKGATCSLLTQCQLYPDEESSSSTGNELPPAPTPSSDGGLSSGSIALIVVIVLAAVAIVGFYLYKRGSMVAGSGQEGLLEGGGETSSLPSGTAFHTLTTEHHS